MPNEHQVVLIHDGEVFTPYYFYNTFLREIAEFYRKTAIDGKSISFKITDEMEFVMGKYRIDPIVIPLLLSLSQQIRIFQEKPIHLELTNVPSTNALIEFLFRSDFFYVTGSNKNPSFPKGKDIFSFDKKQIGGFQGRIIRPEHKIRCYSLNDVESLSQISFLGENEEEKRDWFVEYYSYEVSEHFQVLLQEFSSEDVYFYIDVLSELITNGVMHSGTDVFALMFSDHFSTKFSISDNGIGFESSISKKEEIPYYKKFELSNHIISSFKLQNNEALKALLSIFEALYFSMIKSRVGLFDLVLSVVCEHYGYFRLHNDYAQVVISARMLDELSTLGTLRKEIRKIYSLKDYGKIEDNEFDQAIQPVIGKSKKNMITLFKKMWINFNEDVRFSSIRFFPIRFKGVHIEAEIPK